MRSSNFQIPVGILAVLGLFTSGSAIGQDLGTHEGSICSDNNSEAFHACALAVSADAEPQRTPAGKPDLSGYWRRRTWGFEDFEAHPATPDDFGGLATIVDPPGGKVPMLAWSDAHRKTLAANYLHHNAACILPGPAGFMYMSNIYQFIQDENTLSITGEALGPHPYRIVPLENDEPMGGDLDLWLGDPTSYWDGDTLVIETGPHNVKYFLDQRGRFITDEANIIERLTMIEDDTIHYAATFEDPNVYTRPFTIAFSFRRETAEGTEIWEEACYENNASQMALFRNNGLRIFPGISGETARGLRTAWESAEEGR